jgi:hypothetical protein
MPESGIYPPPNWLTGKVKPFAEVLRKFKECPLLANEPPKAAPILPGLYVWH